MKWFDVAVCFETVEHMQDDQAFVKKIYDSLNVNGILLISALTENVIPHSDNPYFLNRVNPHHYRHYRPDELRRLVTDCGFQIHQLLTQDNTTYQALDVTTDLQPYLLR